MQDDSKKHISQLAAMLLNQGETTANEMGQMKVVACALAALVRSHPDPEAFALAFRRAWMQGESPHEDGDIDQAVLAGTLQMLDVLEGNCAVPLNVRPPGLASPPEL